MNYQTILGEPSTHACDLCSYDGEYDTVLAKREDGEDVGLCIACILKDNTLKNKFQDFEEAIRLEATEGYDEEVEDGWVSKGNFGLFQVTFDTQEGVATKQVAVDQFKELGRYIELRGKGRISLEEPERIETDVTIPRDSGLKESINEDRDMRAREKR